MVSNFMHVCRIITVQLENLKPAKKYMFKCINSNFKLLLFWNKDFSFVCLFVHSLLSTVLKCYSGYYHVVFFNLHLCFCIVDMTSAMSCDNDNKHFILLSLVIIYMYSATKYSAKGQSSLMKGKLLVKTLYPNSWKYLSWWNCTLLL